MARTYSEINCGYLALYDSVCYRVSVSDAHGGEFFCIFPSPGYGKSLRERRLHALNAIEAAIDSGMPPGEVELDLEAHIGTI